MRYIKYRCSNNIYRLIIKFNQVKLTSHKVSRKEKKLFSERPDPGPLYKVCQYFESINTVGKFLKVAYAFPVLYEKLAKNKIFRS